MKITEITVNAGRVFNHPYESYSNLRPSVTLKATLDDGEDTDQAVLQLQAKAEGLVEDHKNKMLRSLDEIHHLEQAKGEMESLEDQLTRAGERLRKLRSENPQLSHTAKDADEAINLEDVEEFEDPEDPYHEKEFGPVNFTLDDV